jgi:hypothetical protein
MSNWNQMVIIKLRLHTVKGCSNNIWLSVALHIILVGLNYRVIFIPPWTIMLGSAFISTFSLVSFCAFFYWINRLWNTLSVGMRLYVAFQLLVFFFIAFANMYITFKILFNL